MRFDGQVIDDLPTYRRARLGIGRTFQRIEVFPELTVRDHIIVAERAQRGDGALWKDLLNMSKPRPDELAQVERVLDMVGLQDVADTPVAALSLGHCRLVELGRALGGEPRLLMADEPSSGLDVRRPRPWPTCCAACSTNTAWPSSWSSTTWTWSGPSSTA